MSVVRIAILSSMLTILLLTLLVTTGCKVSRSASFEIPAFDDMPPPAAIKVLDPEQPSFRIFDDNGRLRLLVQDPITKYYVLVR